MRGVIRSHNSLKGLFGFRDSIQHEKDEDSNVVLLLSILPEVMELFNGIDSQSNAHSLIAI